MQESPQASPSPRQDSSPSIPWWEKLFAIFAVINLLLVLFNLSYIPLRDVYLRQLPGVVAVMDPFKGIEPHPYTQKYLNLVDDLEQTAPENLRSPDARAILTELREQSASLIEENPFMVASKFGTFAKIQRRMRHHLGLESAKKAFERFWSLDYLTLQNWQKELNFFDEKIRPLMASNYYRYADDYGQFIDEFWRIDLFFIGMFGIEFLGRTFLISYRKAGVNWFDAVLRRWYDLLFFLPFWRWLRIVPVTVRLHQTKIINLERALEQVTHEPASYLADRVSKFLTVRIINQAQDSLSSGAMARALLYPQAYQKVGEVNPVEVVTDRLARLTIYKVLPRVQPNLEAMVHYSLEGAFKRAEFYQAMQNIPGFGTLPDEVTEQLANNLAQACVEVLASSYSDERGRQIFDRLSDDFSAALRLELQDEETQQELQALLSNLLEEVKLNYVIGTKKRSPEATMDEVEQLDQTLEQSSQQQE
jgi:hypothetical protein